MGSRSLHFDQAPPLAIPLSFFFTAPVSLACAGGLLLYSGADVLVTAWSPHTLALTHLFTLGFLVMVMLGALYQLTAVIAGRPVPGVRLAHVVHILFAVGIAGLCSGLVVSAPRLVFHSIATLALGLLAFLIPVGIALARAPTRNWTVRGMQLALAGFFLAAAIGLWMAHGHGGMRFPGVRSLWVQVHVCVALLGWVGGLISAVSWQVLPMFYLSSGVGRRTQLAVLASIALLLTVPVGVLFADYFAAAGSARLAALGSLPALAVVWGLHPLATLKSLRTRRRRRSDGSLLFWLAGLACAPLAACSALAAWLGSDARLPLLFGWIALFGWAGMIMHGMLTRIVPFLVWFHRFAPLVGERHVPSVKALLPDRWTRIAFGLHAATLVLGVAAIGLGADVLARALGLALMGVAASIGGMLLHVARQRPGKRT